MTDEREPPRASRLTAGSSGENSSGLMLWLEALSLKIRSSLDVSTATIHVRAYRDPETAMGVDVIDARDACYSMTIRAQGGMSLDDVEPIVPDLVEAIHIVGLLSRQIERPVVMW